MTIKYPKTIGACLDQLYEQRAERLAAQKQIDVMKKAEADLEEHILKQFDKADLNGAKGDLATGGITKKTVYSIEDWPTFIAYVSKKKAWDILYKQAAQLALRERFDNGEEVPGIKAFEKISLSLTKAGGK